MTFDQPGPGPSQSRSWSLQPATGHLYYNL